MFRGDVHARRRQMRAVLDGAAKGDFSLILPEVVRQELVKQYPRRMKKVRKEVARAIGAHATELESLGFPTPALADDDAVDATGYERHLEALFEGPGCRIAELPDLRPTATWAVHRRKPFKESGEGLQDAAIWLTVLDLAPEDEAVLLASSNIKDFGDGEDPPGLAAELREDLRERGLPRDRVRLITSLPDLVEQIVQPAAEADARADRLLAEPDSAARLYSAIERAVLPAAAPSRTPPRRRSRRAIRRRLVSISTTSRCLAPARSTTSYSSALVPCSTSSSVLRYFEPTGTSPETVR